MPSLTDTLPYLQPSDKLRELFLSPKRAMVVYILLHVPNSRGSTYRKFDVWMMDGSVQENDDSHIVESYCRKCGVRRHHETHDINLYAASRQRI